MKIHLIPMGTRFVFEGKEYTKTGPMFGSGEGGQRLIPKYANLTLIGEMPTVAAKKHEQVSRTVVLAAFNTFYAECAAALPNGEKDRLQQAHDTFLQALD